MPPRKKQASKQHAEEQPAPITRLLACDDLLGKVYSSCKDSATRHALRVSCSACYRSPAINSCIHSYTVGPTKPEEAADTLSCFPKHAKLKHLDFSSCDLRCSFTHLLQPAGKSARAKLQHVDSLCFQDCELDPHSAACLPLLFPIMRTHRGCVKVVSCAVSSDALGILATQAHIKALHVEACQLSTQAVGMVTGFRYLETMTFVHSESLILEPVSSGPLQLTKLELSDVGVVTGLDALLACHPLRELKLKGAHFNTQAPPIKLASPTLKELHVTPTLSFPALVPADLPALQLLVVEGLDLTLSPVHNAPDALGKVRCIASSLASFPSMQCREGKVLNGYKLLEIDSEGWPAAKFVEVLGCLDPLKSKFADIQGVHTCGARLPRGAMRSIAGMLPNASMLFIRWEVPPVGAYDDELGMFEAVSLMPRLRMLCVQVEKPPRDTIAALAFAKQAGFQLDLTTDCHECEQRLEDIVRQWETLCQLSPAKFTSSVRCTP